MNLEVANIASFQRSTAALERMLANYIDHGVMLRTADYRGNWKADVLPNLVAEKQAIGFVSNRLVLPTACRAAARDLGWWFVSAEKTLQDNGPIVWLIISRPAADIAASLLLVAETDVRRIRPNDWQGVQASFRPSVVTFHFAGEPYMKLFDDWYAHCYRNPDVLRVITKRGHPIHTYPGGNNAQTTRERSAEDDHHALRAG